MSSRCACLLALVGPAIVATSLAVRCVPYLREDLEAVRENAPSLVLLDLKMPVMDGLTALRKLRESGSDVPVIVITAHGAVDSAIEATRLGATAYLSKPFDLREISLAVSRALAQDRLKIEVDYLRGRDPYEVYEDCVVARSGQAPVRPPRLR